MKVRITCAEGTKVLQNILCIFCCYVDALAVAPHTAFVTGTKEKYTLYLMIG